MNSKRAGILFLAQMLTVVGVTLVILLGGSFFSKLQLNALSNILFSEAILVIPAVGMLVAYEHSPKKLMSLKSVRALDLLLVTIYLILLEPLIALSNLFSQLWVENEAAAMSLEVFELPFGLTFLMMGIVGPVCEELVFRGVIYGSLRRSGHVVGAIYLQALLFGLMHGNLNQFCYAFVIGVFMGYMLEATGSILSTIWMHVLINSTNVVLMRVIIEKNGLEEMTKSLESGAGSELTPSMFAGMAGMAFLMTIMAVKLLLFVAKRNRRRKWMHDMKNMPKYDRLWSAPMVAGITVALGLIILDIVMNVILKARV